ncbi:molybdenum cofactor biosynthesis protein MoaE [Luethyella okanaganae]|uniref:Molybdenum cofactor biosynthesis protein MoaE n=1 Tax=Luethyella okanaganae TaxID=69372 RepID=A0ABW1VES5_9MICO
MPAEPGNEPEADSAGCRIAEVVDGAISMATLRAVVAGDGQGAIVAFEGVVRDHDNGEAVSWLRYTAHPSAQTALQAVAETVAERFTEVAVAVQHRIGLLQIGDVALGCAVASAHRATAFAACAALVDEIKAQVPIWKEQGFEDGHTEWVAALG